MRNYTFVIQGRVERTAKKCCESIRLHYPSSKILISTWRDQDTSSLDYDKLVLNDDPGAYEYSQGRFFNTNRQIVSTFSGLKEVETEFAIKTRADILFQNENLKNFQRLEPANLFQNKIIALNCFFRNPSKFPTLFHIGDIFQIGRTADLQRLWNIPLAPEPDTSEWLKGKWRLYNSFPQNNVRYAPEQYIWIAFLKKHLSDISLDYSSEITIEKYILSEESIAGNFKLLTQQELGIHIPGRMIEQGDLSSVYTSLDLEKIVAQGPDLQLIKEFVQKRKRKMLIKFLTRPEKWKTLISKVFERALMTRGA